MDQLVCLYLRNGLDLKRAQAHGPRNVRHDNSLVGGREASHLEVQGDEREHEALEVLHQVVQHAKPLGVFAVLNVQQRPNLGALPSRKRESSGEST